MSKGEETRRAVVSEALSIASTLGLTGLTIGSLAQAIGMSKSGLFAHFQSKEQLQLAVLQEGRERFIAQVVAPALKQPRGIPRIRALLDNLLKWERAHFMPGGCIFQSASVEVDDRPGPVRDFVVENRRDLVDVLKQAAQVAMDEGQFRRDLDVTQWAFEFYGLSISYQQYSRLMRDAEAENLVRTALEGLLERCA